jgi:solute carrier family 50 protein (sugar transporter)
VQLRGGAGLTTLDGRLRQDEEGRVSEPTHKSGSELLQVSAASRLTKRLHEWLHPLSAAAVVTTVALQMSPLPSSLEIKKARDVKRFDGYPYFAVLAGATQWCLYGSFASWMTHDMNLLTMVAANGPGVMLGTFYVTNFFRFVPAEDDRNAALKQYLTFGGVLLLLEGLACITLWHGAVFWLGLLGAFGSAQIALSPFKTLPEVLKTRSTRSWPLDLCLWNLIQSWFTGGFGVANSDPWVWVPNLIGVIAAIIQLSIIAMFWERPCGPRGNCIKLKAATSF